MKLIRESAAEQLAVFRDSPPPASDKLISDREMEGQMRGLSDVCFQFAHIRAETAAIGSCTAIGYVGSGQHRMRIYRKTAKGWSWHNFTLHVERPAAQVRQRREGRTVAVATRPPVYSWQTNSSSTTSRSEDSATGGVPQQRRRRNDRRRYN